MQVEKSCETLALHPEVFASHNINDRQSPDCSEPGLCVPDATSVIPSRDAPILVKRSRGVTKHLVGGTMPAIEGLDTEQNAKRQRTSLSLQTRSEFNLASLLRNSLDDNGFVVLRSHVHSMEACSARSAIYEHCCSTLRAMGCELLVRDGVPGLLEVKPWSCWYETPENWDGKSWGIKGHSGYNRRLGGGRMFSSKSFLLNPDLRAVQNRLRDINAALYGCAVEHCIPIPEGASLKFPGTDAWHDHLDGNREGSFQNIISLCHSSCVVYPGSHKKQWNHGGKFYFMSDADQEDLSKAGIKKVEVLMELGDVLIMKGAKLVHGVPAVAKDAQIRCMSFSHFTNNT